jgi:MraZ protein
VSLDAQGRIQLSPDYRERAGLDKDVLVIGMLEHFEVWNPERWKHLGEQREPLGDLFDRVARKGV